MFVLAKKLQAVGAGIVVFIFALFLLILIVINFELSDQDRELNVLSQFTSSLVRDINEALTSLNNLPPQACTQALLTEMQRVLIMSKFVKEAGVVSEGKVVCSTSEGTAVKQQVYSPINFCTLTGVTLYVDLPSNAFNKEISGPALLTAQSNAFYVAADGNYVNLTGITSNRWEVVHNHNGKVNHLLGTFGVFNEHRHKQKNSVSLSRGLYSNLCILGTHFCSVIHASWPRVFENHAWVVSFFSVLGLTCSYAVFVWLYPFSHRQKSTQFRVETAIENASFRCVYQPIVELKTGKVRGYEMLSRLHDRYGEITPKEFIRVIKLVEKTWVFTIQQVSKAIIDINSLPNARELKLSFNIFPEDLTSQKVNELIALCQSTCANQQVNIEIVEDEVLDTLLAAELIELLAVNSIKTSIDDFGTGYSNLSKLGNLKCDYLKIDRAFIENIEKGSLLSTLVPQIIQMAKQLNLETVAEGIEIKEQEQILLKLGVHFGQGWYYGKPLPITYWQLQSIYPELDQK